MEIVISTFLTVKAVIGARRMAFEVPNESTVGDALDLLVKRFGQPLAAEICESDGSWKESHVFAVNGQAVRFRQGMETVMQAGDELLIFPPVGGG